VIDFEIVIHKAVNFKWPTAKIIGCRFHLAQGTSMVQKNPIFGINKILQKSQFSRGAFLKLFLGTPFLKPSDVEEYFLGLCEILPCNNSGIVQFSDYIIDNYISEEALFLRHIRASASNVSYRTTNACESFHAKFNTTFYQNHSNLYQFIEVLLQFQSQIYAKINGASKIKKLVDKPA
jgi:hypothetical protein